MKIEMSIYYAVIISFLIHACGSSHVKTVQRGSGDDEETYTKILLDNEEYSIASVAKHPKQMSHKVQQNAKAKHRLPADNSRLDDPERNRNGDKQQMSVSPEMHRGQPSASLSGEGVNLTKGKKSYKLKTSEHFLGRKIHKTNNNISRKKSPKRRFVGRNNNEEQQNRNKYQFNNQFQTSGTYDNNQPINRQEDKMNQNYLFSTTLRSETSTKKASTFHNTVDTSVFTDNTDYDYFDHTHSADSNANDLTNNISHSPRYPDGDLTNNPPVQNPAYPQKFEEDSNVQEQKSYPTAPTTRAVFPLQTPPLPEVTTPPSYFQAKPAVIPSMRPMTFSQADIAQRSPPTTSEQPNNDANNLENLLKEESEGDDTVVAFGESCDQKQNETCWIEREIGDVLTLSVRIDSSKDLSSFQVRWFKIFRQLDSKKGKPLELEPGKLPWNMVSGSEGREMRLNPVTNADTDPNCIVAKVFSLNKNRAKTLFTLVKKLTFRVDIPITDMGKIYAGEELSINIENFITLPERGNLVFDWALETSPHELHSLPSNIKVSTSGRSIVLKELKKGRMGVLSCMIYSTTKYAVAKRRFNILNIDDSVKKRSPLDSNKDSSMIVKRNLRCRRIIRRSQEEAIQRLEEGSKPKSRQKRFRRRDMPQGEANIECEPLKKKVYSRWIRSLFGDSTTLDSRVMPLEKLFELSENGDGTLDDVIPREIHYVEPKVKYVDGTAKERSADIVSFIPNCSNNTDCSRDAFCVILGLTNSTDQSSSRDGNSTAFSGYCSCRPEFYGDGLACHKIPAAIHREKRLKRHLVRDREFSVPEHLFYETDKTARQPVSTIPTGLEDEETPETQGKILAYEEQESFLLSDCIDDKDCNMHASCVQPTNGHPYCKCRPGFRGNGIFCWEIMDYVPPEETFLPEEDIAAKTPTSPSNSMSAPLVSRTPSSEEMEDDD